MRLPALFALTAAAAALAGCSTIIDGKNQQISVNTNPAGATCTIERNNGVIAQLPPTPSVATIRKTKEDIVIRCRKDGYMEGTILNHSGINDVTYANAILGGLPGWAFDSATGADNQYDPVVNMTLNPQLPVARPKTAPVAETTP